MNKLTRAEMDERYPNGAIIYVRGDRTPRRVIGVDYFAEEIYVTPVHFRYNPVDKITFRPSDIMTIEEIIKNV